MSSETNLVRYYGRLERILKEISLRIKLFLALEFFLRLVSIFLIILLGSLFAQEIKDFFPYLPFVYYLLAVASLMLAVFLGLQGIFVGLTRQGMARGLEERFPHLTDDVTNALLLFRQIEDSPQGDRISKGLVAAHMQKAVAEISEIQPERIVDFRKALAQTRLIIPLLTALAVVLALDPTFLGRSLAYIFHPLSALPARETFISLEPVPSLAMRGASLVIKAKTTGYTPDRLALRLWPEGSTTILHNMTPVGKSEFSYSIASVQASFRYQAYGNGAVSSAYQVRVVEPPAIARIKLTLIPPGYSRLPSEVAEGGHIEALKGTTVSIEALATKAVVAGTMVMDGSKQVPLKVSGARLQGNLVVSFPGNYTLSIRDGLGFTNPEPVRYRISLLPDKYPEGEIVSPGEDLEISANEVVPVAYRVKDDFGVTAIRLLYQRGETQRAITLKNSGDGTLAGSGNFNWNLGDLSLIPGERVAYSLEVWDNDAISGPKAGYSRTLILQVRNEREQTAGQEKRAQEISDALLGLLADHLEGLKDRPALAEEIIGIREKVERNLKLMGQEKVERYDLESLKRNLAALAQRIDELPQEKITQELERLSLLAEDLTEKARMHSAETLAGEIKNRQSRLSEVLQDQKGPLHPEALQEMLHELERLKDLARQLTEALMRMASQLPEEFINSPELSNLNLQDLFQDIEEIQRKLLAGDLKGAQEATQRLLQNLSAMMAAMARAGAQASKGSFDRLQSEMARQSGELEKILAEQQAILAGTESLDQELRRLVAEEKEKRPRDSKSKREVLTEDPREEFPRLTSRQERLREKTEELGEALEMLSQLFPAMDTEIINDFRDAAASMGRARGKLQGEDTAGAIPPEEEAIRSLSRSQQAMQQMEQQMAMRMQANRWGYPLGYDPLGGWYYGPWTALPTLPQPKVKQPRERGNTGMDKEEFAPPPKDAYKAPRSLREMVLEELKEEIPPQYRKEVQRYFRGLTE